MSKKVTLLGFTLAAAMLLSYVESLIPPLSGIPGIKIGLANIAVIFALWHFGIKEAILVSIVKILLSCLLFGNFVAFLYSVAGAIFSLFGMILLKSLKKFSVIGVSIAGGVLHNTGQITAAIFLLGSNAIVYYLPVLILSGTVTGALIGVASGLVIKRFNSFKI